jgi:hypothetical protein
VKISLTSELLANGQVIREPVGSEKGYWAGAPGAFFAADEGAWYLTYRIRRPRGVQPDRGGEARIARSIDLANWEDVWSVTKDNYNSASIERSAVRKGADGQWRYFTSYVDPADGRWCVSVLKAKDARKLDPTRAQPVFKAQPLGLEGVKDPWLFEDRGIYRMVLSIALRTPKTNEQSHSTLDIYNTGQCVSATGLATSKDLDEWEWQGMVFTPENVGQASCLTGEAGCLSQADWDDYCRRINSIVPFNGKYIAFYDGRASHLENYEEKTGLAVSSDLKSWNTLTPDAPRFTSLHASGSLRYMDAQVVGDEVFLFYEFARPDGAHDLRLVRCNVGELPFAGVR